MITEEQEQNVVVEIDPYLISPKSLHLEMPLYHTLELSLGIVAEKVYGLLTYSGTVDAYCIWCEKESVFNTTRVLDTDNYPNSYAYHRITYWKINENGFTQIIHTCTRDKSHKYYAYYFKSGDCFLKIGQYPSAADFQIPQAEKYRKILENEQYKEFTKGLGLAAHGVGIGSFVYLRRVFENLIEDAYLKVKDKNFPEGVFEKARMDERIKMLKEYLPEFLVENRKLYAILSKGIHQLGEDECQKYFETVKIGIEQILDEKIVQKEKAEKMAYAREAIQKSHIEISKI